MSVFLIAAILGIGYALMVQEWLVSRYYRVEAGYLSSSELLAAAARNVGDPIADIWVAEADQLASDAAALLESTDRLARRFAPWVLP